MEIKIKQIRENAGLSQEKMAEKMNITQSSYARFELSKSKSDLNRIESFANALGMSVIDVITYPEKYINTKDVNEELNKKGPEIIVQIKVKENTKKEFVHIPVIITESGLKDVVYNDFYIGKNADVVIVAGCGIHNPDSKKSEHNGIHSFHIGKNSRVKYVEKHFAFGNKKIGKKLIECFRSRG